ncbi:MAG: nitroreductase family protein [Phycisphaerae bacterium]|jgi:nitroreductase|nr:nitroreductase family protein [Phycisphaerae bacterium]
MTNCDYESLMNLIKKRRSVRRFADLPIDRADIDRLADAARWAPSNHNRQGWKFVVFSDADELARLAGKVLESLARRLAECPEIPRDRSRELLVHATGFALAPCVILVMHKPPSLTAGKLLADSPLASGEALSAAMATQNMLLAACAMGLASCVFTGPLLARDVWEQLDDLPMGFEPTCLMAVGYPAGPSPDAPRKKRLEQIIEYRSA